MHPTDRRRKARFESLGWRSTLALVLALAVSVAVMPLTASAEGEGSGTDVSAVSVWGVPGTRTEGDPTVWTVELPYSEDAAILSASDLVLADPGAVATLLFDAFTFQGTTYPARDYVLTGDGRGFQYFKVTKGAQETLYKVDMVVPEAALTSAQALIAQINQAISSHGTFQVRQNVASGSQVATWLGEQLKTLAPGEITSVSNITGSGLANLNAAPGTAANPQGTPSAVVQVNALFKYQPTGFGEIGFHYRGSIPVQVLPVTYDSTPQGTVTAKVADGQAGWGSVSVEFVGNEYVTSTGSAGNKTDPLVDLYTGTPRQQFNGVYYSRYKVVATADTAAGHFFDRYQIAVVAGENVRTVVDGEPPTQVADQSLQGGRGTQTCYGTICYTVVRDTVEFWVRGGLGLELTASFTPDKAPVFDNWRQAPLTYDLITRQQLAAINTSLYFRAFPSSRYQSAALQPGKAWLDGVELPASAWSGSSVAAMPGWAEPGQHTLRLQAFDGTNYSDPLDLTIDVAASTTQTEHTFQVRSNLPLTGEGGVGATMRYTSGTAAAASALPLDDLDGWPIDTSYQNGIFIDNYTDVVKPAHPLKAVLIGTRSVVPSATNQAVPITGATLSNGNQANAAVREFQGRLNITFPLLTPTQDIEVYLVFDTGEDPAHTASATSADPSRGTVGSPLFLKNHEGSSDWLLAATPAAGFYVDYWQYRAAGSGEAWTRDSAHDRQASFTASVTEDREYQVVFREPGFGVSLDGTSMGIVAGSDAWNTYGITQAIAPSYLTLGATALTWAPSGTTVVRPSEQLNAFDSALLWFPIGFEQAVPGTIDLELFAGDSASGDPIEAVSWDGIAPSGSQSVGLVKVPVDSLPLTEKVTVRLTAGANPPVVRTYPLAVAQKDNGSNAQRAAAIADVLDAFAQSRVKNTNIHGSPYVMTTYELKKATAAIAAANSAADVAAAHQRWVRVLTDTGNHIYHSGNRVSLNGTVVTLPPGANAGMYAVASMEQRWPGNWTFHASSQYGAAAFGSLSHGGANDHGKIVADGNFGGTYVIFNQPCMNASTGADQFGGGNACPYTNGISIQTIGDGGYSSFGGSDGQVTFSFANADPAVFNKTWYSWPGRMGWSLGELREAFTDAELSTHDAYTFALAHQNPLGSEYAAAFKGLRLEFLDFLYRTSSPALRDTIRAIASLDSDAEGAAAAVASARSAYDALSSGEKAEVFNYADLTAAEAALLEGDAAAAFQIDLLIEAIGEVEYTQASRDRVVFATAAFDAATPEVQALVTGIDDLDAAIDELADLADAAVADAESKIEALPATGDLAYPDDVDDVASAQAALDRLLSLERSSFDEGLVGRLDAAEARLEELRQAYLAALPHDELALDWLEAELAANGHGMPGFVPGAFDWGLTADAVLALAAGGRSTGAETVATTENLLDHVSDYATWDDFGPDYPGVRIAGALGKLNLVAEVQGIDDTADTDGFDLEAEVRATMETTGPQAGRFSDVDPHFGSNNANGFGQALAMLSLSYSDDGVPAPAVTFLLDQQCPGGGFRLTYSGTPGCESAASSDTDTSALALMALLVVDRTPAVNAALIEGLDWLESKQDASGGWGGTGPTAIVNANSSGLIAQALAAAGRTEAAGRGSDWIAAAALTAANTGTGPGRDDLGAIGYTYGSRDDAIANGIDAGGRDQWRRATAQAVLGLGLPDYGSINRSPANPVTPLRSSAESFVTAAYTDFLGRPPTTGELATQVPKVGVTVSSRAALARGLAASDEWIGKIVVGFYEDTLGRGPDPSGKAFWINQLRTGRRTVAQAAAEFYASNEYFRNRGGNTVETWVTDLYERLLHRAPDPAGKAFWVSRTKGRGRVFVAGQMYQSAESRRDRVARLYVALLGRQPDPAGRDYWAGRILTQGDIALAVNLASSNEYLNRSAARFP